MLPRKLSSNKPASVEMIDLRSNKAISTYNETKESKPEVIITNRSIINLSASNKDLKATANTSLKSNIKNALGLFTNKVYVLLVIAGTCYFLDINNFYGCRLLSDIP